MRISNIDTLSALIDRLITERIKQFNFEKEDKYNDAIHQQKISEEIIIKIKNLLSDIFYAGSYDFISEKRTYDAEKLIKSIEGLIESDLNLGLSFYTQEKNRNVSTKDIVVTNARSRIHAENRAGYKNMIDDVLKNLIDG